MYVLWCSEFALLIFSFICLFFEIFTYTSSLYITIFGLYTLTYVYVCTFWKRRRQRKMNTSTTFKAQRIQTLFRGYTEAFIGFKCVSFLFSFRFFLFWFYFVYIHTIKCNEQLTNKKARDRNEHLYAVSIYRYKTELNEKETSHFIFNVWL